MITVTAALLGSAGNGRVSGAARADFAEAAVNALLGSERDRVYELAGDEAYSQSELAAELSRQSGTSIACTSLEPAQYRAVLLGAGLPESMASLLVDNDLGIARGDLEDHGGALRRLLGRPTTTLAAAVGYGLAARSAG